MNEAREILTQKFQEYDENRENELDEDIEIVVECQDVKPAINLLPVKKTDDYSQNYLRNMKYSEDYKTQPTIKTETLGTVKKECFSDETTKLYSDCELREQNEKRSHIDKEHSDRGHMCDTCGKKLSTKANFKIHVNSIHNHITPLCDICKKKFSSKFNLKKHIESVHNGTKHTCRECGKAFTQKSRLQIHIDSVHKNIAHYCDTCGKTFKQKNNLKRHITGLHSGITYTCDTCQKIFTRKDYLKINLKIRKVISKPTWTWCIIASLIHVTYVKKNSQVRVISKSTLLRPNNYSFGKFQVRNMDSCGLFSGAISVKDEPCDVSFTEDDYKTIDNTSDTKHFQHLIFLQGNTISTDNYKRISWSIFERKFTNML
uniref:C2H2-type domain-containing protein n=1 Tax=Trichogramma kaykai TaxID=54128 RepID=A0ABD2XD90_9HYME